MPSLIESGVPPKPATVKRAVFYIVDGSIQPASDQIMLFGLHAERDRVFDGMIEHILKENGKSLADFDGDTGEACQFIDMNLMAERPEIGMDWIDIPADGDTEEIDRLNAEIASLTHVLAVRGTELNELKCDYEDALRRIAALEKKG